MCELTRLYRARFEVRASDRCQREYRETNGTAFRRREAVSKGSDKNVSEFDHLPPLLIPNRIPRDLQKRRAQKLVQQSHTLPPLPPNPIRPVQHRRDPLLLG